MRTASPFWASLAFGIGLVLLLLGERIFASISGVRTVLTVIGLALVVAVTLARAYTFARTTGTRRKIERTLLLCQLGCVLALVLYAISTHWGLGHFSLTSKGAAKAETVLTMVWAMLITVSLIPMFMIELSLGFALRDRFEIVGDSDEALEYMRVREIGWSGLSIGLALCFLMVTCNVANERNISRDVSYFRTSSPGQSSIGIASSSTEPIKVLLYFPEVNEVKDQVKDYFQTLAAAGGRITIEERDHMVDPDAQHFSVKKDGVIVLVRGTGDKEKFGTIEVDTDLQKARKSQTSKLRNLDREVNTQLLKLVHEKRKAYLTVGHGELTDPDSIPVELKGKIPDQRTTVLKKRLVELGYETKSLGLIDLDKDVPEDAALVMIIGATGTFEPAEYDALNRYLDRGGKLFIALDPKGQGLGPLEGHLGVKFNPGHLTDDEKYLKQRGSQAEKRAVITTQFSAHGSTTSLSRAANSGLVLFDSGALEDAPFTVQGAKKTITVHSFDSSYLDLNNDFQFSPEAGEKKQKWDIAAAVEGPKIKGPDGKDKDGYRAVVYADAVLFADALVGEQLGGARLIMLAEITGAEPAGDAIHWLGGEENFAGEVVSEDDKSIQHSKGTDDVWFALTVIGAPLIVLGLGLTGTMLRRRRRSSKKPVEVKS
ncbi:MAG TPA: Gldg family protein [Kofleriaceae bacterium]|nr:Gldg family protein [Kofleriaceae bacterium]